MGGIAGATSGPLLSGQHVLWVAIGIGVIALVAVLMPVILAWCDRTRIKHLAGATPAGVPPALTSFFELPYITWFLVHYLIPVLAILAIVLLGIDGIIDKGTVSALLGSLFGYVLGSSAHSSPPKSGDHSTTPGADEDHPPA